MDFAHRLATARKTAGLTQQVLADRVGIHVSQLRRYEAGTNQPTLEVLRALAVALSVTTDSLVFGDTERGPRSENLRLRMEALDHLEPDEQALVIAMIEGALLRHHARQLNVS
ncbi:MAG: helix-turn-helix domain-containing protein [Nostocoides sp.]